MSSNAAVSAGGAAVGAMTTNTTTANVDTANGNNNAAANAAFPSLREAFCQAMLARLAGVPPPAPLINVAPGEPLPPCPWVVSEPMLVEALRRQMTRLGLTEADLGTLIGRDGDYVRRVLDGLLRPTLDDLYGIHDYLGTSNISVGLLVMVFLGEVWHTTGERYRLI